MVLSDDPTASNRISEFSDSSDPWMVAVRMVSEGVDVPRLAVGVYATSASTPLFFAQAIGRFVRSRRPGETASIFLPSVPNLLQLASELEAQRNHVLGKPHRESDGLDDELIEDANKTKDEKTDQDRGFESLGADAELDQVIFDGSSFGTAAAAGSEEEADYLGIPGLLDASQMRDLLSRRQDEQLQKRTAAAAAAGMPAPRTTHGQLQGIDRASSNRQDTRPDPQRAAPDVRRAAAGGGHRRADQGAHRRGAQPLVGAVGQRLTPDPPHRRGTFASRPRGGAPRRL